MGSTSRACGCRSKAGTADGDATPAPALKRMVLPDPPRDRRCCPTMSIERVPLPRWESTLPGPFVPMKLPDLVAGPLMNRMPCRPLPETMFRALRPLPADDRVARGGGRRFRKLPFPIGGRPRVGVKPMKLPWMSCDAVARGDAMPLPELPEMTLLDLPAIGSADGSCRAPLCRCRCRSDAVQARARGSSSARSVPMKLPWSGGGSCRPVTEAGPAITRAPAIGSRRRCCAPSVPVASCPSIDLARTCWRCVDRRRCRRTVDDETADRCELGSGD